MHPWVGSAAPLAAPEGDHGIGHGGGLPVTAAGEGKEQVDRDRLSGRSPRGLYLTAEVVRGKYPDRAQPARVGNGRGQLMGGETASHPCLHDRKLDPEPLLQPAHAAIMAPSRPAVMARLRAARRIESIRKPHAHAWRHRTGPSGVLAASCACSTRRRLRPWLARPGARQPRTRSYRMDS